DGTRVALPAGTLVVDCTARAVERRPAVPVYQPGRIVLQMVRVPQPTFSAALIARLEAAPDHPTTLWFPEGEYLKGLALLKR
ncbi:MAG TPA: hypothetical protein VFX90_03135, partial [Rhodoferax sp.]|nr:hypothetical protein [Rhodoferax sp.]